jgi:uncharacterized protein YjgD (DUF1641 family)
MARPIPFDPPKRDPRLELIDRLERAPIEHAAALLDAYQLLQALHDRGMIDTARGFVGSADEVLDIAVKEALRPASVHAMRNAVVLFNMLGSIDPDTLKKFTGPIPQAIQVESVHTNPPGLFHLLKGFLFDKDFRRGLSAINGIIRGIGLGLNGKTLEK